MGGYGSALYEEEGSQLARAWPRFWARIFDTVIYSAPAGLVMGFVVPGLFNSPALQGASGGYLAGFLCLPLVMVFDAVVISQFGSSPGKAIAGLYVADLDRNNLSLKVSLDRNLLVYLKGVVLGIPLLCLVGYGRGYAAVEESGFTSWDAATNSRVFSSKNNEARTVLIGASAIIAIVIDRVLAQAFA